MDGAGQLGELPQRAHREQVRRDEQRVDARIVRRPETGEDEPHGPGRVAVAVERERVCRRVGGALETVRPRTGFALLLAKSLDD